MRGYAILGAGFDVAADKYDGWTLWPGVPDNVFPPCLGDVSAAMKNLYMKGKDHPHACRGVGVCVRFLEACEVLNESSST